MIGLNGIRVTEKIVLHPETITIQEIQAEKNLEVQRVMIERFGVEKYLEKIECEVIDTDIRGIEGGGARCLLREKNGNQWLVCTDGSTERVYHLSAPKESKTCKDAHEALSGFSEAKIKMEG